MATRSSKLCKTCNKDLPLSEFSGRKMVCKPCRSIHETERYRKRREYLLAKNQLDSKTPEVNKQYLIDEYKNRMSIIGEIPAPVIDNTPNTYIYVLTSADLKIQKFKIGVHTGTLEKLKSRYRTYFEDITVLRFVSVSDQNIHEKNLHQIFQDYKTHGEWFNLDQQTLTNKFDEYIRNNISIMDQYVPRHLLSADEKMLSRTLLEILQDIDSPKHNTGHTRGKLHKALSQVPEEAIIIHEIIHVLNI